MRYRDLLTVLFLVATASWIWAEPTREVKMATPASATEGWTVPNLDLDGSTRRIEQSGEKPAEPKRPSPAPVLTPGLEVSLRPGKDLASTIFDVQLRGRDGLELVGDGPSPGMFLLRFDPAASDLTVVHNPSLVGPNRWRFRGSDVKGLDQAALSRFEQATLVISATMIDEKQSRFSRGANFLVVESEPVHLSFR